MDEQLEFGQVRNDHPDTAQAAARQLPNAGTDRRRVLTFLRVSGGATDEEIQTGLHLDPSTERPRRVELVNAGLAHASPDRRLTRSGRQAIVWKVNP